MDGFAEALALSPEGWSAVVGGDEDAAAAFSCLSLLAAVARHESVLDSVEIDTLHEHAPAAIATNVLRLHAWRARHDKTSPTLPTARSPKVARNESCPCGSGKSLSAVAANELV